jgi:hypothetical protein
VQRRPMTNPAALSLCSASQCIMDTRLTYHLCAVLLINRDNASVVPGPPCPTRRMPVHEMPSAVDSGPRECAHKRRCADSDLPEPVSFHHRHRRRLRPQRVACRRSSTVVNCVFVALQCHYGICPPGGALFSVSRPTVNLSEQIAFCPRSAGRPEKGINPRG